MEYWHIWTIVAVLLIIVEIFTSGFAILCFSIGAFCAALGAAFGIDIIWQILLFAIGSVISLLFVRPLILKYLHTKKNNVETNAGALIGREASVTEPIIENNTGRVKIDGDIWQARSNDGSAIKIGEIVIVTKMESIVLTVKKK